MAKAKLPKEESFLDKYTAKVDEKKRVLLAVLDDSVEEM